MKKDVNIESATHQIEIFDTGIAFLAGLMIIPAVFVFSPDKLGTQAGPGLMFETLPAIFERMPGGAILGAIFFALVLLAALTSSISLMETIVSIFQDKFKWGRKTSCLAVLVVCIVLGLPSSLGFGPWSAIKMLGMDLLTFFDFISNGILMPIAALFTCIVVGYIIKPKAITDEVELSGKFKLKSLFNVMIKYVAPFFLVLVLISSILDALGIVKI